MSGRGRHLSITSKSTRQPGRKRPSPAGERVGTQKQLCQEWAEPGLGWELTLPRLCRSALPGHASPLAVAPWSYCETTQGSGRLTWI